MLAPLRLTLVTFAACLLALLPARATVSIVTSGATHTQNFDTLPAANFTWVNDTTLPGWFAADATGALNTAARTLDGTANPNDLTLASVGATTSTERALAYHTRVAATPTHLGLAFVNNSGSELTAFSLAYAAEQWKESASARNLTVTVHYRVGASATDLPATSGWTGLPTLSFNTLGGTAPSSTARSVADIPVSVPAGSSFWIRWTFSNSATSATSSHDILAIDDVVFSATAAAANTAPAFTTQPASRTVSLGESVTFTSAATGNPAPTFQWFKGTAPIPAATSSSYTIASATLDDSADYHVVATNSVAATPSATATLTVSTALIAPSIITPPSSLAVRVGDPATFTVTASGSPTLLYQWFKGTAPIPTATSASYTIPVVTAGDVGVYHVVVTNSADSATSASAQLSLLLSPVITTQPASQTVTAGGSVTFSVAATGDGTLTYQWRKGGEPLPGATTATLTLTNVQLAAAGAYDVVVTNAGGPTPSAAATLTVNAPPTLTTHPASRSAYIGESATFTVAATGTAPLSYQWLRNGLTVGTNSPSLTVSGLQLADSGATFAVTVSNAFGSAPSGTATLTVTRKLPDSAYNLTGFATLGAGTTGGGIVAETAPTYRKCYTAFDFVKAISDSSKTAGAVRVIEIMNDLDLGYNEVDDATRALGNFRAHAAPKLHPRLLVTGVSMIDIATKGGGLTIFSANGSTIRHTCLNFKGTSNLILRNLRFDEMWEWDEATKGDYDSNDWDFIDFSNGSPVTNVWVDHCTFTKAYDGIADLKKGTQYVTFSWCRYVGDDGATNPNSFVRQQIDALEANRTSYAFYNFLRNNGFSKEDIIQVIQGHDKGHLMGATEKDAENNVLSATFHHQWFENIWDRCVPRLRGGQVHSYNIYVDDSVALAAKRLRDARKAAMSSANQLSLENTYSFNPFLNGSISTEGAAILVEKSVYIDCLTPLRNNQTDVNDPTYTGKIKSEDSIYVFHNTNGTTTTVRGDSTDAGNPMGPFQAAVIPFSWNTPDGSRPYPAPAMDDPANLRQIVEAGAGAGRLTWDKSNWLRTTYTDPAPTFATWADALGLTGPAATPTADTDGDGVPLLLEYALGLDPLAADASAPGALPALVRADASTLTFRFTRSRTAPGVTLLAESTPSLTQAWQTVATAAVIESQTAETETLALTLPAPSASAGLFVRLRATATP
jgi:pectate lyase